MTERCPFDGEPVKFENGYCAGHTQCDDNCAERSVRAANATRDREIAEAVRPWREMVQKLYDITPHEDEMDYDKFADRRRHSDVMDTARALLDKAGK